MRQREDHPGLCDRTHHLVSDSSGEAFYIRDEQSGQFWSPTPLPAPSAERYVTRHGFGYSSFEPHLAGIASTLTTFVAIDAPIRDTLLRVKNLSATSRRLSLTIEFLMLLSGLLLASEGIVWGALAYLGYSLLNAISAWLILSGRV